MAPHLLPVAEATPQLPFRVADYVDFFASADHAGNVGKMMRPDSPALPPNWRHLPIGYHARSGTVVVTGADVRRPYGQRKPPHTDAPVFGPSRRLDLEAELGYVVGAPSTLGEPVPTGALGDHVFGVVGLNEWSARDVQGRLATTSTSRWRSTARSCCATPPPVRSAAGSRSARSAAASCRPEAERRREFPVPGSPERLLHALGNRPGPAGY